MGVLTYKMGQGKRCLYRTTGRVEQVRAGASSGHLVKGLQPQHWPPSQFVFLEQLRAVSICEDVMETRDGGLVP
jgi:hypothetical protein